MQDPIALLQSLTLPAGATTGQRIELDGTTGEIRFYSAAGNLVLQLDGAAQLRFFQDIVGGGLVGAHQVDDLLMLDPGAVANTFEVLPTGTGVDAKLWGKSLPRGVMALAERSTSFSAGGAGEADVTSLSVTWTADATRRYRISCHGRGMASAAIGSTRIAITDSANTHVAESDFDARIANTAYGPADASVIVSGISGSVTYKVRALTVTGGGVWTFAATPNAYILVEDIGSV